jgi:ubiquinone/menaquinone biosynthesis C-methylase UbiE
MAAKEFEVYTVDQEIRLAKERQEQLKKVERVLDNGPVPTTAEMLELLRGGKK